MHGLSQRSIQPSAASKHRAIGIAVALVTMIALAPSARAQESKFAISAFGGYNIAADIYNDLNGGGSLELKNSFMWGGRATLFTNRYSAVEFSYARNGSDLNVRTSALKPNPPSGFDAGRINLDEYDFNVLISQPTGNPKVWPYFTMGIGWTLTHPDVKGEDPNTLQPINVSGNSLFAFNFGFGGMIKANPNLSLRLDARWRVTDTNINTSSGVYCDYWGYCWTYASSWYNSGELTAGLTYHPSR